ncbi:MAG: hypothetical protein AAFV98_09570 [Chloroflexota bacterium]
MARQYPSNIYIGQKVTITITAGLHSIEALVTKIDYDNGRVHVNPIGYKTRWSAKPQCISNREGKILRFENNEFTFANRRAI